jgi:hypothetical protein
MIGGQEIALKVVVEVWGEAVEIDVYQQSKTVWVAAGTFRDKRYKVEYPTEDAAIRRWIEKVRLG